MDYRKLSARSRHHAQATERNRGFPKSFPARLEEISAGKEASILSSIEVWFARRGARPAEKNKIPRAVGPGAERVPQRRATSAPPRPISSARSVRKRATGGRPDPAQVQHPKRCSCIWMKSPRMSRRDAMPSCFSIRRDGTCPASSMCRVISRSCPLPAKCPELNPTENIWEFMRDNWLSATGSSSTLTMLTLDHCCEATGTNSSEASHAKPHVSHRGMRDWALKVLINDTWY